VVLIALVLVVVTGTWPPLVAVESSSIPPTVNGGDLVVVTATDRFPWDEPMGSDSIEDTRTAPPERYGRAGDVVVFTFPIDPDRPILHRVAFHVSAGEDWTKRGDPAMVEETCDDLGTCPAPYDRYVTYGDANNRYDQSVGIAPVVHEGLIHAKALVAVVVSIDSGVLALAVGRLRDGWQRRGTR
jgi:signal peptidase